MPHLVTKLDRAVIASIAAMLALNVIVFTQQLRAAPVAGPELATVRLVSLA